MEKQTRIKTPVNLIEELILDEDNILELLNGLAETQILLSEIEVEHRECDRAIGYAQKLLIGILCENLGK